MNIKYNLNAFCPKLEKYEKPILIEKVSARYIRLYEDTEIFGVLILKGYETNGASVPRLFWFLLSPFTEGFRAAIIHDFRYTDITFITREEADLEFYDNMQKDGVGFIRRYLVYLAVRTFAFNMFIGPPK